MRDYHLAQEELRSLRYSILKDHLISADSSRQAQLQWLGEFMVFAGSNASRLTEHPDMIVQAACNQPSTSAPYRVGQKLVEDQVKALCEQLRDQPPPLPAPSQPASAAHSRAASPSVATRSRRGSLQLTGSDGRALSPTTVLSRAGSSTSKAVSAMASKASQKQLQQIAEQRKVSEPPALGVVPRRWIRWVNKPQRNRVVAEFAGFASEVSVWGALLMLYPAHNLLHR